MEVKILKHLDPVEFTGKFLDKRNNLTAPKDGSYPKQTKHVSIQQPNNKEVQ